MAVTHAAVKAPGERVFAVADWNASHIIDGSTGEILFREAGGTIGTDSNLFWDDVNKRLGVQTSNPLSLLAVGSDGSTDFGISAETSRDIGVVGYVTAVTGDTIGVYGVTPSTSGTGVVGENVHATGTGVGVHGAVDSVNAWAGYFTGGKGVFIQNNLGIGTASPENQLHIYDATDNCIIKVETDKVDGAAELLLRNDAQDWRVQLAATDAFQIYDTTGVTSPFIIQPATPSNTLVLQATTGNVGINIISPEAKLHIIETTEQLRLGYDADKYVTFVVGSDGNIVIDAMSNFAFKAGNMDVVLTDVGDAFRPYVSDDDLINLGTTSARWKSLRVGTGTSSFAGSVGIGVVAPGATLHVSATDGIIIPIGTTAQRVATQGMIRYNTTTSRFEGYTGVAWVDFH